MTTKIFSDNFSDDEYNDYDFQSDIVDDNIEWLESTEELFKIIKKHLYDSYYFCILDNAILSNFLDFLSIQNENSSQKYVEFNLCKCPHKFIPSHQVYNYKNMKKWKNIHFDILMYLYTEFLCKFSNSYDFNSFAEFCFIFSSDCNCKNIEDVKLFD